MAGQNALLLPPLALGPEVTPRNRGRVRQRCRGNHPFDQAAVRASAVEATGIAVRGEPENAGRLDALGYLAEHLTSRYRLRKGGGGARAPPSPSPAGTGSAR